jgi:hypothetical protein
MAKNYDTNLTNAAYQKQGAYDSIPAGYKRNPIDGTLIPKEGSDYRAEKTAILEQRAKAERDAALKPLLDKIAKNQTLINKRETDAAKQSFSAARARRGRSGSYSLLGSMDRLGS